MIPRPGRNREQPGSRRRSGVIFGAVGNVEGEEVMRKLGRDPERKGGGGFEAGLSWKVPAGKQEQ